VGVVVVAGGSGMAFLSGNTGCHRLVVVLSLLDCL